MTTVLTLLFPSDLADLRRMLPEGLYAIKPVSGIRAVDEALKGQDLPLILCDQRNDWKAVLELSISRFVPKVILCATRPTPELWAEMFNLGGYDLLGLPFDADNVKRAVKLASLPLTRTAG